LLCCVVDQKKYLTQAELGCRAPTVKRDAFFLLEGTSWKLSLFVLRYSGNIYDKMDVE